MRARYTVGTISGWRVPDALWNNAEASSKGEPLTSSYVYDSAFCYLPVAEFHGDDGPAKAARLAVELNERSA